MNSLSDITAIIDDIKGNLSDDQYLKLMNSVKNVHAHVLKESTMEYLSEIVKCNLHGIHCECEADDRVNALIEEIGKVSVYLRTIAAMARDIYLDS